MSEVIHNVSEAGTQACPRCEKPLVDPYGLGWCKSCGFCRSLEEEKQLMPEEETAVQPSNVVLAGAAVGNLPTWFWMVFVGWFAILLGSYAVGKWFTVDQEFQRAVWTSCQIALGVFAIFSTHFYLLLNLAAEEPTLVFKDAMTGGRLWGMVGKRLPQYGGAVQIAAWGLALIVCASFFIGGLMHWFTYLPGRENNPKHPVEYESRRP